MYHFCRLQLPAVELPSERLPNITLRRDVWALSKKTVDAVFLAKRISIISIRSIGFSRRRVWTGIAPPGSICSASRAPVQRLPADGRLARRLAARLVSRATRNARTPPSPISGAICASRRPLAPCRCWRGLTASVRWSPGSSACFKIGTSRNCANTRSPRRSPTTIWRCRCRRGGEIDPQLWREVRPDAAPRLARRASTTKCLLLLELYPSAIGSASARCRSS